MQTQHAIQIDYRVYFFVGSLRCLCLKLIFVDSLFSRNRNDKKSENTHSNSYRALIDDNRSFKLLLLCAAARSFFSLSHQTANTIVVCAVFTFAVAIDAAAVAVYCVGSLN